MGAARRGVRRRTLTTRPGRAASIVVALITAPAVLAACGSAAPREGVRGLHTWSSVDLTHIACPAAGACEAVGTREIDGMSQPIVVEQSGDSWGKPIALSAPVPTENGPDDTNIACSSPGNCVVDGWDGGWSASGNAETDLFSESNGRWNTDQVAIPQSLLLSGHLPACSPGGECWSVVGRIAKTNGPSTIWTYAVGVASGHWTSPFQVGRVSPLPHGTHLATVLAYVISCSSSDSCTTVGQTLTETASKKYKNVVFAQSEKDGVWGNPTALPPLWKAPASGFRIGIPGPQPLACVTPSNCLVVGSEGALEQGAIAQMVNGVWETPTGDIGVVGRYVDSVVSVVACDAAAALCVAAGNTASSNGKNQHPFAQVRIGGHWLAPTLLTGLGPDADQGAFFTGAVCPTPTTCDVVGQLGGKHPYSFVAGYRDSRWRSSLVTVDGTSNDVLIDAPSCASAVCWVAGEIEGSGGVPTSGIVLPLSSVRLSNQ